MAAFRGSVECVRSLLASGAEVNLADDADLTPLMVAAIQGCNEVVGRKAYKSCISYFVRQTCKLPSSLVQFYRDRAKGRL